MAALLGVLGVLLASVFVLLCKTAGDGLTERATRVALLRHRDYFEQKVSHLVRAVSRASWDAEPDWALLEAAVEALPRAAGEFVFLLDEQGQVRGFPELRGRPDHPVGSRGGLWLAPLNGHPVRLADARSAEPIVGIIRVAGADRLAAIGALPDSPVRLVVESAGDGLAQLGLRAMADVALPAGLLGGAILAITAVLALMLLRRHDKLLEQMNVHLTEEVERRVDQSLATRDALIFGLAKLADYRDSDTGRHLERICGYVDILARRLQHYRPEITETWIEHLHVATCLHDIGKVGIPDHVLLKPGPLTPDEREIMERHPIIGADTLLAVREKLGEDELVNLSIQIALSHHERWDGEGYPCGLAGEEIPLSARLVALADVYDALTSQRVYKPCLSHTTACRIIRDGAGRQFDPLVVQVFIDATDELDACRRSLLDDEPLDFFRLALPGRHRRPVPPEATLKPTRPPARAPVTAKLG